MRWFRLRHGPPFGLAGAMLHRIGRKLKLTEQQQGRLSALHGKLHEVHADVHEVRRATHRDVESLLRTERLDRDAALRLVRVPRYALEEHLPVLVDRFADFYDSLSTDQRERMLALWLRHQRRV